MLINLGEIEWNIYPESDVYDPASGLFSWLPIETHYGQEFEWELKPVFQSDVESDTDRKKVKFDDASS